MFKSTLTGDYTHIYSKDPALDRDSEAFDHDKWIETGDDKYLPVKDGLTPVRFTLKRLPPMEHQYLFDIGGTDGPSSMAMWAVAMGVRKIEPLKVDGKDATLETQIRNGRTILDDEWQDRLLEVDEGDLAKELARRIIAKGNTVSPRS